MDEIALGRLDRYRSAAQQADAHSAEAHLDSVMEGRHETSWAREIAGNLTWKLQATQVKSVPDGLHLTFHLSGQRCKSLLLSPNGDEDSVALRVGWLEEY